MRVRGVASRGLGSGRQRESEVVVGGPGALQRYYSRREAAGRHETPREAAAPSTSRATSGSSWVCGSPVSPPRPFGSWRQPRLISRPGGVPRRQQNPSAPAIWRVSGRALVGSSSASRDGRNGLVETADRCRAAHRHQRVVPYAHAHSGLRREGPATPHKARWASLLPPVPNHTKPLQQVCSASVHLALYCCKRASAPTCHRSLDTPSYTLSRALALLCSGSAYNLCWHVAKRCITRAVSIKTGRSSDLGVGSRPCLPQLGCRQLWQLHAVRGPALHLDSQAASVQEGQERTFQTLWREQRRGQRETTKRRQLGKGWTSVARWRVPGRVPGRTGASVPNGQHLPHKVRQLGQHHRRQLAGATSTIGKHCRGAGQSSDDVSRGGCQRQ